MKMVASKVIPPNCRPLHAETINMASELEEDEECDHRLCQKVVELYKSRAVFLLDTVGAVERSVTVKHVSNFFFGAFFDLLSSSFILVKVIIHIPLQKLVIHIYNSTTPPKKQYFFEYFAVNLRRLWTTHPPQAVPLP